METSPIIRFRIDRAIAERAYRMAAASGLELPDVMRMMLTKAVRIGDFSIDQERSAAAQARPDPPQADDYAPRYWSELKPALDAETALATLHHAIAERTAQLDLGLSLPQPDLERLERIRNERDEACTLLAAFDPRDTASVSAILDRFTPASSIDPTGEPRE